MLLIANWMVDIRVLISMSIARVEVNLSQVFVIDLSVSDSNLFYLTHFLAAGGLLNIGESSIDN